MDLEEYVLRNINKPKEYVIEKLFEIIKEYKNWDENFVRKFAESVYEEVKISKEYNKRISWLLDYPKSNVKAGEIGLGSRGEGDFFVHEMYKKILDYKNTSIEFFEDAGCINFGDKTLVFAIDGMHSRLSEFPFIAGFHACRASARDVMVKGGMPLGFLVDVRLGDDADVSKLYDFMLGISIVSNYCGGKILSGSTLRIGGDMVFGSRIVGTVACVGICEKFIPRYNINKGDIILLTKGSGGGTISTIAIYNGYHEVVLETINMEFYDICKLIIERFHDKIHSMTDITNGGIRKDSDEICKASGKKLVFYYEELRKSVNPKVLKMLDELEIDFLGISLDSIMIIVPENYVEEIKNCLKNVTDIYEVGYVDEGFGAKLIMDNHERDLSVRFRESPYTKVKKVIGDKKPENYEEMKRRILKAIEMLMKKKERIEKIIYGNR